MVSYNFGLKESVLKMLARPIQKVRRASPRGMTADKFGTNGKGRASETAAHLMCQPRVQTALGNRTGTGEGTQRRDTKKGLYATHAM